MMHENILNNLTSTEKVGNYFFGFNFSPFFSLKDLIHLSKTNKKLNQLVKNDPFLWAKQIETHVPIDIKLFHQFVHFCQTQNITIDYQHLFKNLYKHRRYFILRPISNFKYLYAFAFKNDYPQELTNIFQPSVDEINKDPQHRRLLEFAYLLANKTLMSQTNYLPTLEKDKQNATKEILACFAARGGHVKLALKTYSALTLENLLQHAILSGSVEIIQTTINAIHNLPLQFKLQKKLQNKDIRIEPLIVAAVETDNVEILQFVVERYLQGNYDKFTFISEYKRNLLHIAAKKNRVAIIKYLIEKHPEYLLQADEDKILPITVACKHAPLETVKLFFKEEDKKNNAEVFDIENSSLLWFAILNYDRRVFDYLVKECNCNLRHADKIPMNIIHHAIRISMNCVEFLKEQKYFTPEEFNQLLNTKIQEIHIVELAIIKGLQPEYITGLVAYLEKHQHLDTQSAKFISSDKLLTLFALCGSIAGINYAETHLNQKPTEELLQQLSGKIDTLSNSPRKLDKQLQKKLIPVQKYLKNYLEKQIVIKQNKQQQKQKVLKKLSRYLEQDLNNEQVLFAIAQKIHHKISTIPVEKIIKMARKYLNQPDVNKNTSASSSQLTPGRKF